MSIPFSSPPSSGSALQHFQNHSQARYQQQSPSRFSPTSPKFGAALVDFQVSQTLKLQNHEQPLGQLTPLRDKISTLLTLISDNHEQINSVPESHGDQVTLRVKLTEFGTSAQVVSAHNGALPSISTTASDYNGLQGFFQRLLDLASKKAATFTDATSAKETQLKAVKTQIEALVKTLKTQPEEFKTHYAVQLDYAVGWYQCTISPKQDSKIQPFTLSFTTDDKGDWDLSWQYKSPEDGIDLKWSQFKGENNVSGYLPFKIMAELNNLLREYKRIPN